MNTNKYYNYKNYECLFILQVGRPADKMAVAIGKEILSD